MLCSQVLLILSMVIFSNAEDNVIDVSSFDCPRSFDDYLNQYQKSWYDSEYEFRRSIYERNCARIQRHNDQGLSYRLGVDWYTDWEAHEMVTGYDKKQASEEIGGELRHEGNPGKGSEIDQNRLSRNRRVLGKLEIFLGISLQDPIDSLPSQVDWSKAGVTTPVKNQGMCGSCWAFASTAVLESHLALQTGTLMELSVQQLVSCAPNPNHCGGDGGCEGSTSILAFDHVIQHGMLSEWEYGYHSYNPNGEETCPLHVKSYTINQRNDKNGGNAEEDHDITNAGNFLRSNQRQTILISPMILPDTEQHNTTGFYKGAVMGIEGWVSLPRNDYVAVMNALVKLGPLAVSVACHPWFSYHSGVFPGANFSATDAPASDTDVNHMVVLEGYGTDEVTGEDFWLVRNSWGPKWGEGGYIRLKRDANPECSIDVTPANGIACTQDDNGQDLKPPNAVICGNSGILYDVSAPTGGFLI